MKAKLGLYFKTATAIKFSWKTSYNSYIKNAQYLPSCAMVHTYWLAKPTKGIVDF